MDWTKLADPLLIWVVSIELLFMLSVAIYLFKTRNKKKVR